jgi:hypothetical protein
MVTLMKHWRRVRVGLAELVGGREGWDGLWKRSEDGTVDL